MGLAKFNPMSPFVVVEAVGAVEVLSLAELLKLDISCNCVVVYDVLLEWLSVDTNS